MKELSIVEKAKAYDEAIKYAHYLINERCKEGTDGSFHRADLQKMFPQLAESEDEKIIRTLKEIINWGCARYISVENDVELKDCLAWLEKQVEQKHWDSVKPISEEDKLHLIFDEQNPVDKVEPKFKIEKGKWYICIKDLLDSYTNKAFHKGDTYLSTQDGSLMPSNSNVPFEVVCPDAYFRDWTIQDANPGDVLTDGNDIVIFKENNYNPKDKSGCMVVYCSCNNFYEIGGINPTFYKPTTKKQRDTLMKAIADAGYTFDFNKKELKEIEQSPAWSEEDEMMLESVLDKIGDLGTGEMCKEWLKSIKERVQPQNRWNPSDEQMQVLVWCMPLFADPKSKGILESLINDLKKLREE